MNSFTVSIFLHCSIAALCSDKSYIHSFIHSIFRFHWKTITENGLHVCMCAHNFNKHIFDLWVVAAEAAFSWRRVTNLCVKSFNISIPFHLGICRHRHKPFCYVRVTVVCYCASVLVFIFIKILRLMIAQAHSLPFYKWNIQNIRNIKKKTNNNHQHRILSIEVLL